MPWDEQEHFPVADGKWFWRASGRTVSAPEGSGDPPDAAQLREWTFIDDPFRALLLLQIINEERSMAPRSPDKPEMQKAGSEAVKAMTALSKVLDKALKSAQVVTKNPDNDKIADLGDQLDEILESMKAVKVVLKKVRGG